MQPHLFVLACGLLLVICLSGANKQQHQNAVVPVVPASAERADSPDTQGTTLKAKAPLSDLIKRLPKAELHIHIEGTLEPDLMFKLAARNNITLPYPDVEAAVAARSNFTDLQSFLDEYQTAMSVLLTQQDFEDLATAYLERAAAQNITHAEIFFDVQTHIARGVPFSSVMNGLQSAIEAARSHPVHPIDAHLILCLVRELGQLAAATTLVRSLPYIRNITALGLASSEVGNPPELFRDVYRTASLLGLHKVAHAGEEGGPDYVWSAIRVLGVERIDHGIRSIEDPVLVQYLVDNRLPITLCPLSNLLLKVYAGSLPDKLRQILTSGIVVTINSDDPAYFSGYLNANYEYVTHVADLGPDDVAKLARNSFAASFIPGDQKLAAFAAIQDVLQAWKDEQQQQQQLSVS